MRKVIMRRTVIILITLAVVALSGSIISSRVVVFGDDAGSGEETGCIACHSDFTKEKIQAMSSEGILRIMFGKSIGTIM